jgi:hypothetical protein
MRTQITEGDDDRCLRIAAAGEIEFTDDDRDVVRISPDGYLIAEEERGSTTRRFEVRPGSDGRPVRTYWVNDIERPIEEGRAWISEVMLEVIRATGANAKARVARIHGRGGVPAVLDEISHIASDGVKRRYYSELLALREWPADTLRLIARSAGRQIASDGEKAALLKAMVRDGRAAPAAHDAVVEAAETIASDGEKRGVLSTLVRADGRETLVAVARAAKQIASDGEKAGLLLEVADRYVRDAALRAAYLDAAESIASDGEKGRVLRALLDMDTLPPAALVDLLRVAGTIASDGEKSAVLRAVTRRYSLENPEVRRAFLSAAASVASDGEKRAALGAAVVRRDLSKESLLALLRTSSSIASDGEKAALLLQVIDTYPMADADVRDALLAAAERIASDSEYRRVMSALTRAGGTAGRPM